MSYEPTPFVYNEFVKILENANLAVRNNPGFYEYGSALHTFIRGLMGTQGIVRISREKPRGPKAMKAAEESLKTEVDAHFQRLEAKLEPFEKDFNISQLSVDLEALKTLVEGEMRRVRAEANI
jgi:hypothetical protein